MSERKITQIVRKVCEEKKIKFTVLSFDWIMQLEKENKIRHIYGNRFDLNGESGGSIACDKYATYEVLASQNVPVISHVMLYNPQTRAYLTTYENNEDITQKYWLQCDGAMVVKPNHGQEGVGVYLCKSLQQVNVAINKLFERQDDVSLCKFYDIETEYRCFYLDGEILLVYGKEKPYIIGDGEHDVQYLMKLKYEKLLNKATISENMQYIDLQYIPKINEQYELSWKFNLSGGAKPSILLSGELKDKIVEVAKQAGNALNVRFVTIDIIYTKTQKLFVLEVNSGVCMTKFIENIDEGEEIAKEIYSKAVDKMFESK